MGPDAKGGERGIVYFGASRAKESYILDHIPYTMEPGEEVLIFWVTPAAGVTPGLLVVWASRAKEIILYGPYTIYHGAYTIYHGFMTCWYRNMVFWGPMPAQVKGG